MLKSQAYLNLLNRFMLIYIQVSGDSPVVISVAVKVVYMLIYPIKILILAVSRRWFVLQFFNGGQVDLFNNQK
jgi:hypothetical protein